MNVGLALLIVNLFATMFMVGLIWFVQIVHYPLFGKVGQANFTDYQQSHQKLTTFVVAPPMLIEAFSTVLLAWYPPDNVSYGPIFTGIALLFVIWLSTACLQVPCHGQLLKSFQATHHRWLVLTNWIRTIAWSARGGLVGWMMFTAIRS